MTGTWKSLTKEELVNVGTLSKKEFDKWMTNNYSEMVYKEGFQIVKENLENDKDDETANVRRSSADSSSSIDASTIEKNKSSPTVKGSFSFSP